MTNAPQIFASQQTERQADQFGRLVVARLSGGVDDLPYEISERLRSARVRAVSQRKILHTRTAAAVQASGGAATLSFGDEGLTWWSRLASALPILALLVGLISINTVQNDNRVNELAEVDSALLTDDLPPAAYSDPGFLQFLQSAKDRTVTE